jgi:hypothetical protein
MGFLHGNNFIADLLVLALSSSQVRAAQQVLSVLLVF